MFDRQEPPGFRTRFIEDFDYEVLTNHEEPVANEPDLYSPGMRLIMAAQFRDVITLLERPVPTVGPSVSPSAVREARAARAAALTWVKSDAVWVPFSFVIACEVLDFSPVNVRSVLLQIADEACVKRHELVTVVWSALPAGCDDDKAA